MHSFEIRLACENVLHTFIPMPPGQDAFLSLLSDFSLQEPLFSRSFLSYRFDKDDTIDLFFRELLASNEVIVPHVKIA